MATIHSPNRQQGFALIEVLVSILLMSFTMFGLAGLLGTATRMQLGVESRSTANQMMNDLANRIRANLDTTTNGYDLTTWAESYTDLTLNTKSWSDQQSATMAAAKDCLTEACSRTELADFDVSEIRLQMARNMPQPALYITGDAAAGIRITMAWFDKDATRLGTGGAVELETTPTCSSSDTSERALSCCPAVASVGSTPGVRCLNLEMRP